MKMEDETHALYLRDEIVTNEVQHDLDKLGIAKTAREEKTRARDAKLAATQAGQAARGAEKKDDAYNARMAQLYREVVLKEKPATSDEAGFIPQTSITPINGNGHNGNGLHGIQAAKRTEAKETEELAELAGD